MEMYCKATGLPFSEHMMRWEPKAFPEWIDCPYYQAWHGQVIESSGFKPPSSTQPGQSEFDSLPPECQEEVKRAQPYYEKLYSLRSTPCKHMS